MYLGVGRKKTVGKIKDKVTGISQKVEEKAKTCKIGIKNEKIRGTFQITQRPKKRENRRRKSLNT